MRSAVNSKLQAASATKRESGPRAGRQRRWRNLMLAVSLTLALIGIALGHVWLRLQIVHMGYVLSTATKLQSRLEQEQRQLKVELATLTAPERVEAMARKRLGLASPEKGQVIVLP